MVTNKCKTLALAALVLTAPISVSAQTQAVLAESIALPTLSVLSGKQLKLSLAGVECGQNEYFTDKANVSILANGTPLEFIRTCHDSVLAFTPISRSENDLFVEILLKSRNLNLRYMASARSYAYNDWQLAPVKEVLKQVTVSRRSRICNNETKEVLTKFSESLGYKKREGTLSLDSKIER